MFEVQIHKILILMTLCDFLTANTYVTAKIKRQQRVKNVSTDNKFPDISIMHWLD